MDTRALRQLARGVALTAALGALAAAPATAGAASKPLKKKQPVVKSVSPMSANVGDTLKIRGKYFRLGKGKNSVVFKRDNSPAIFVKADISTKKVMSVVLPKRLEDYMAVANGVKQPTKFRIRILARRLGKKYTRLSKSPTIGPEIPKGTEPPPAGPPPAEGDCDGDGTLNGADGDDDNDLLDDALEGTLGTDQCKSDTDGDGVGDAYEYKSAIDLNDDEYQDANESLPYPGKRPYPNPLDDSDANVDFDGDGLTLGEEWDLWVYVGDKSLFPLSYSDGEQYSASRKCTTGDSDPRCGAGDENRRIPTLAANGYAKHEDFRAWTVGKGYDRIMLTDAPPWYDHAARNEYDLFDMNRDGAVSTTNRIEFDTPQLAGPGWENVYYYSERYYYDTRADGWLSDAERDEDADGLTNWDELHSRMTRAYWDTCYDGEVRYNRPMGELSHVDADSDGDGVRDGADDQDNDDVPNVMELSRNAASGLVDGACRNPYEDIPEPPDSLHADRYGWVHPYDPCLPDRDSRTCAEQFDFEHIPNPFNGDVLEWVALN